MPALMMGTVSTHKVQQTSFRKSNSVTTQPIQIKNQQDSIMTARVTGQNTSIAFDQPTNPHLQESQIHHGPSISVRIKSHTNHPHNNINKQNTPPLPQKQALVTDGPQDFVHHDGVAIVTKIHGPAFVSQLVQSMCLLKAAYNNRPKYDVIVFTTEPLSLDDQIKLQNAIHPAKLNLVLEDKKTVQEHLVEMTNNQVQSILKRCSQTSIDELAWGTRCCEDKVPGACMPLAYTWQCEFRSLHLWTHPALLPYQWMMWFDTDAMATKVWEQDPVAFMLRQKLKILFAGIKGKSKGHDLQSKIQRAYNHTLCNVNVVQGQLHPQIDHDCTHTEVRNIHGYFHITDLDFYRKPENLNWFQIMIGETKFSRRWDDQLAVTVPAAMREPHLAWEMEPEFNNLHGIHVYHNLMVLGQLKKDIGNHTSSGVVTNQRRITLQKWNKGGFKSYWRQVAQDQFPEGEQQCHGLIQSTG